MSRLWELFIFCEGVDVRYRRKPAYAIRFTGKNICRILNWMDEISPNHHPSVYYDGKKLVMAENKTVFKATIGYWIVYENEKFSLCNDDYFKENFIRDEED